MMFVRGVQWRENPRDRSQRRNPSVHKSLASERPRIAVDRPAADGLSRRTSRKVCPNVKSELHLRSPPLTNEP